MSDNAELLGEMRALRAENERLQAVLGAARGHVAAEDNYDVVLDADPFDHNEHSAALKAIQSTYAILRDAVRALDGEVKL